MNGELLQLEPWLDKAGICEFFACSERWIEERMKEGMPHSLIAGRIKFKASSCEAYLEQHGHMREIA